MDSNPTSTPAPLSRSSVWATAIATATGNVYLLVGTIVFSVLALIAAAIPPRGRWHYFVGRLWARLLLAASFVRVDVERPPATAIDGRYVYLANHQSLFDIPVLFAALPGETKFLAKRSLFLIPVFGWAMRAGGFIPVDRKDRGRKVESFQAALAGLGGGASVVLFPEETRSFDGRILPLRRGGFLMAAKSGLPAVLVGIEGTLAIQKRSSFAIHPGRVRVRMSAPFAVDAEGIRGLRDVVARARGELAELAGTEVARESAATNADDRSREGTRDA